jgi:RNA polymerase sigma-70 factor (ECF subfamily)
MNNEADEPVGGPETELRVQAVAFLSRHQRLIHAYAYSIVNDFHLAEDVAQEVALVVAGAWEEMPAETGPREAWLREVIRRKALELRRRHRGRMALLPAETLDLVAGAFPLEQDQPQASAAMAEREALARCLARLGGDARTVVEARYLERLDCSAIAERVRRPISSVYTVLKRARIILAECVGRTAKADA